MFRREDDGDGEGHAARWENRGGEHEGRQGGGGRTIATTRRSGSRRVPLAKTGRAGKRGPARRFWTGASGNTERATGAKRSRAVADSRERGTTAPADSSEREADPCPPATGGGRTKGSREGAAAAAITTRPQVLRSSTSAADAADERGRRAMGGTAPTRSHRTPTRKVAPHIEAGGGRARRASGGRRARTLSGDREESEMSGRARECARKTRGRR